MMTQTMDLAKGATTHSGGAEVMEGVGSREPHSFPGNLQKACPSSRGNSSDGQSECSSMHSNHT